MEPKHMFRVRLGVVAAALLVTACGTIAAQEPGATTPVASTTTTTTTLASTTTIAATTTTTMVIVEPATASIPAVRVDPPIVAVAPPPVPPPTFDGYPCNQYAATAIAAGWPIEQIPKVLRTMWRESNCQPWVMSRTFDRGLMQINWVVLTDWRFQRDWPNFDRNSLFDPFTNLAVAHWLWGVDGWTPWRGGA